MKLFYILLVVTSICSFFHTSTSVFVTSGILTLIQSSTRKIDIGRQTFLGPAGFALGGFLSGVMIDHFPTVNITCYTGMFIIFAVFTACLGIGFHFLLTDKVTGHGNGTQNNVNGTQNNVNLALVRTLQSFETWLFFAIVVFHGTATGLILSFSFLYLKEMHATTSLMGLSMTVAGVSAVLFFHISQYILNIAGGAIGAMALSNFFWFVRCLFLYYMRNPYSILIINVINGLTNSLFIVCYMEYIKNKFPDIINTVMCGIVVMLHVYGGAIISFIVGGKLYMEYGGRRLFLFCAIACAIWSLITFVYAIIDKIRKRNNQISGRHDVDIDG